ncbi:hypothetical protein AVEN_218075-1 [Araneus ventricosus]|uniref:Uncharacterized protein n=1 Tax=Araneus ventricosus TaxID=182803 RepID=A0A4Y2HP64_ARAVE|nr:hypothetical protein AVEN_218075-1 [Araneus ventricosus]
MQLFSNYRTTPAGGLLNPCMSFSVQQAQYTVYLQWSRVSNLESSGSEAETLPLGYIAPNGAEGCQHMCRPRHLTVVENYEAHPKIALVCLQNGTLI